MYRPLQCRGKTLLIHWCYYPDRYLLSCDLCTLSCDWLFFSYDSYVSLSDVGLVTVPEIDEYTPPQQQWYVSQHWLEDSDIFNEWMNEEDYEMKMVCILCSVGHISFASRLIKDIGLKYR